MSVAAQSGLKESAVGSVKHIRESYRPSHIYFPCKASPSGLITLVEIVADMMSIILSYVNVACLLGGGCISHQPFVTKQLISADVDFDLLSVLLSPPGPPPPPLPFAPSQPLAPCTLAANKYYMQQ